MQCVILAAGEGKRLRPLTASVPKPLVLVAGVPLLDHIIRAVPAAVTEFIIVHSYLGEQIQAHCGDCYFGRPVTYLHQETLRGTGDALWHCREHIRGRFLYMFADDIHGAADLERLVSYDRAMLTYVTATPERFGVVTQHADGSLANFVEKSSTPPSNRASTGVFVLDQKIFDFPPTIETNGEFYHTNMIEAYAGQYPLTVVDQELWLPVAYPEDIKTVTEYVQKQAQSVG